MTISINELRRLAQVATPGPWQFWRGWVAADIDNDGGVVIVERPTPSGGKYQARVDANFKFIVATNPQAILELLDRLEAAEKHAAELEEHCTKWEAVFGHLGDTPDECGNTIIAARDELEERCATLTDALRLAVRQNSHDMLMTAEELRWCEAILGESK